MKKRGVIWTEQNKKKTNWNKIRKENKNKINKWKKGIIKKKKGTEKINKNVETVEYTENTEREQKKKEQKKTFRSLCFLCEKKAIWTNIVHCTYKTDFII